MLLLFRHQRAPPPTASASAPRPHSTSASTRGRQRGSLDSDDDCKSDAAFALTTAGPAAAPAAGEYQLPHTNQLALAAPAPPRRRSYRYRSRNCENFRRYGDFCQLVDMCTAADDAEDGGGYDNGYNPGTLRVRRRRGVRAHDRLLAEELRDMQQRVAELERQRDLMHSTMLNAHANAVSHAMDMVKQFYVLFANGYNPTKYPQHGRTTEAFLRAIMDEDVVCTEFRGVDLFLQQYQVSSEVHASLHLSLKNVMLLTSESADGTIQIKAEAVCTMRIKRETLERLFPPIIRDEELTQRLIGCEYVLQYDKVFHFHGTRVFQHESRVDFCTGILNMVKDPFVAMKLLEASLMTRHGHFKLDDRIEEDSHTLENSVL